MKQTLIRGLSVALGCAAASALIGQMALGQTPPATGSAPASNATTTAAAAPKAHAAAAQTVAPMVGDRKALYTLGVLLSRNLDSFALTDAEFVTVRQGFIDGYHHKPETKDAEASIPQVQALQHTRSLQIASAYLDKAAKSPGATTSATGLIYIPVVAGTGASPLGSDRVKVKYEGRLADGTVFDSSAQHGGSATFPVTGVIACWTEALQRMKVGGKSRIVCPSQIAYGDRGAPPRIRPGSVLEFDIELLEIEPAATAAPAPPQAVLPNSMPSSSGAAATVPPP
jgi:FKBP-type peptidyl-prolyl cis-trans isomerase FkpA